MDFGLSDAQLLLRSSIAAWLEKQVPIERVRRIMESESGWDGELLRGLGEQGVAGLLISEEHGGTGLALLDVAVAAQELGRAAAPINYHAACVLAPLLLADCGSAAQQQAWLPRIAAGEVVVAPVLEQSLTEDLGEDLREDLGEDLGEDTAPGRLDGSVPYVPDATHADAFLVEKRTPGGTTLHLLPRDAPGISVEPLLNIDDSRRMGEVRFEGVELTDDSRLPRGDARAALARALQAARIALAADSLGASQQALHVAVDYARARQQFGRVIGSFQAVKHLCAEMVADIDPVQALLWYTAFAWDQRQDDAAWLAALLKAHASEVGTDTATKATQVMGGIGFTWECDLHLSFKRIGYNRQLLGGPEALRAEAAALQFGS